ncbi:MAG: cation diffusion facilitator family transporter, partial [Dehalococcoidia bacterium]
MALKLGVGLAIGSISVLSDALDSGMDLVGAMVALTAIRVSARPADREHPYGHGKMENVSGIVESLLIFGAAGFITVEAVRRLDSGATIDNVYLGIAAMSVSVAINSGLAVHLRRVARRTGSIALEATAWHRRSDIVTSTGVLVALVIVQVSGSKVLDPAMAIAVAAFIVWTALRLFGRSFRDLLDARLPDAEENVVRGILLRRRDKFVSFHGMRTRRSGRYRYVELHLVLPRLTTVAEAHELTDQIETEVEAAMGNTITII